MDNNYIKFRAIYYYDEDDQVFYPRVPGFDEAITDAESLEELYDNLVDVVTLCILDDEEEGVDYKLKLDENWLMDYDLADNEHMMEIRFFLPYERSKVKEVYVKKTLTVPMWLNRLATDKNVNFSRILQEGLKEELGIR